MHLLGAARSRGGGAGALQGGARQQSQTAGASHTRAALRSSTKVPPYAAYGYLGSLDSYILK